MPRHEFVARVVLELHGAKPEEAAPALERDLFTVEEIHEEGGR